MEGEKMAILRSSDSFFPSIPSLIDNLFSRDLMDWNSSNYSSTNTTLPAVNIKETDNEFNIEVAAPGMQKEDFKLSLDNNRLTISSEKKEGTEDENEKYTKKEFSYQSFQRSFTLAQNIVDQDNIKAKYSEGILYITIPKREEVKPKPAREIKIS